MAEPGTRQSVASDLFGGVELINGAFVSVTMAIGNNLGQVEMADLDVGIHQNRSDPWRRDDFAAALRSSLQA